MPPSASQHSDSPLPVQTPPEPIVNESPSKRMTYNQAKHTPLLAFYITTIFNKSDETKTKGISKKKIDAFFDSESNINEFIKYCELEKELKYETIKNKETVIKEKLTSEKKKDKKEKKEKKSDDKDLNEWIRKAYFSEMKSKYEPKKKRDSSEIDEGETTDEAATSSTTRRSKKKKA